MKKTIYLQATALATCMIVTACGSGKKANKTSNKNAIHDPQLIIGNPVSYSSDSLSIFPVGLSSYIPSETAKPDNTNSQIGSLNGTASVTFSYNVISNDYNSSISTYVNENTGKVDIRNLVFYNRYTGENYKLTNEKLHIISFSIHNEFKKPIIMYHVVQNDYNKDTLFDYQDPTMLYISDLNGKKFTQLSPQNEQFMDYFFFKETNKILMKVKTDTDSNKVFDPYDQCIYREASLHEPKLGTVLFGEQMISDLKKLL